MAAQSFSSDTNGLDSDSAQLSSFIGITGALSLSSPPLQEWNGEWEVGQTLPFHL